MQNKTVPPPGNLDRQGRHHLKRARRRRKREQEVLEHEGPTPAARGLHLQSPRATRSSSRARHGLVESRRNTASDAWVLQFWSTSGAMAWRSPSTRRDVVPVAAWSTMDPPAPHWYNATQVITGWDQGLLGAAVGEVRKLDIPAEGYGKGGFPAWGIPRTAASSSRSAGARSRASPPAGCQGQVRGLGRPGATHHTRLLNRCNRWAVAKVLRPRPRRPAGAVAGAVAAAPSSPPPGPPSATSRAKKGRPPSSASRAWRPRPATVVYLEYHHQTPRPARTGHTHRSAAAGTSAVARKSSEIAAGNSPRRLSQKYLTVRRTRWTLFRCPGATCTRPVQSSRGVVASICFARRHAHSISSPACSKSDVPPPKTFWGHSFCCFTQLQREALLWSGRPVEGPRHPLRTCSPSLLLVDAGRRTGSMPLILNSTSSSRNDAEASACEGSAICTQAFSGTILPGQLGLEGPVACRSPHS